MLGYAVCTKGQRVSSRVADSVCVCLSPSGGRRWPSVNMWCVCSFSPGGGGAPPTGKLCQRGPDQDSVSGGPGSHCPDAVCPGGVPGFSSRHHSKQPACASTCAAPSSRPPTPPSSAPPSTCHATFSRFPSSSWPATPSPPSGWPPPALPTSAPPTIRAAIAFVFTAASAAPPPTAASTSETSMCQRPGRQRAPPPAQGGRPPWPARLQSHLLSLLSASDGHPRPFPRTPTPHQPALPLPTEDPPPAQRNAHLRHGG